MRREICIDSVPGETRVALLEDGLLAEILIERDGERGAAGNVYVGRVRNILPGMQAAFVDIGLDRDGFLYVEDAGGPSPAPDDALLAGELEGGPVDHGEAPVPARAQPQARIEDLVREGQEVVVQVAKDAMARKGARVTTHVALPGRLLVFLPGVDHVGVSRRIEDEAERERLRAAVRDTATRLGAPGGFIVRTAGSGLAAADFEDDARDLVAAWSEIVKRRARAAVPSRLHQEAGAVERALRDILREGVEEIIVDSDDRLDQAGEWLARAHPAAPPRLRRHEGPIPLFEARGVQIQLERALRPRVWLRSGGSIVIEPTEALVAIDVNTGKFVGRDGIEETVVRTNLEAVREIVRQIRLRDLGGIIVIDFIDMPQRDHRAAVLAAMEQELRRDRARSRMLQISEFGLVEITRQRTRPGFERVLGRACPTCAGVGRVKSIETLGIEIIREGLRRRWGLLQGRIVVRAHPETAGALRERVAEIARVLSVDPADRIEFHPSPGLRIDQWEAEPRDRSGG